VGLSPVLQFMILPVLIYRLSFKMQVKKWNQSVAVKNHDRNHTKY
jgi:hypothetical protein